MNHNIEYIKRKFSCYAQNAHRVMIIAFLGIVSLLGCFQEPALYSYDNSDLSIQFMHPSTWKVQESERIATQIVLESKRQSSFYIVLDITLPWMVGSSNETPSVETLLSHSLANLHDLYNLTDLNVVPSSKIVAVENHDVQMTTINIPKTSLPSNSIASTIMDGSSDYLSIDIYAIGDRINQFAMVKVYRDGTLHSSSDFEQFIKSIRLVYPYQ